MQNFWILFIFIHSFLKGTRDGMQKSAMKKSSSTEILFFFSLIGLLLIIPFSENVLSTKPILIFYAFIKAVVVSIAWIFSYISLKKISVGLYGVLDMSRMLFTTLLAVTILGESFTLGKILGLLIVSAGLVLVNLRSDVPNVKTSTFSIAAALVHCFLIAVSSTMDKVLTKNMMPDQLQFYFMLFSTIFYAAILLVKDKKITVANVKTNWWIPVMSLSLVFGDRLMFKANASPLSDVTTMSVIKQSAVLFSILTGRIFFKEKNVLFKLFCGAIILCGILVCLFLK